MDFISPDQLQKYQDIIQQINCEYRRHEELKDKIVEETDKITIAKLSTSDITERITHVDLEIFSNITELLDLYSTDIPNIDELLSCSGCKFYLTKIYITTTLLQKLNGKNWLINICLRSDDTYVGKTMHLSKQVPMLIVLPVDDRIIDGTLECKLTNSSVNQFLKIELSKIFIDISYHFRTYKKKQRMLDYRTHNILQITKNNTSLSQLHVMQDFEYNITYNINPIEFKQNVIRNCYHNLGIDQFVENDNEITVQFACKFGKSTVTNSSQNLCIRSNMYDLYHLKIFFNKLLHKSSDKRKHISLSKIRSLMAYSHNVDEIYRELRHLWSTI